MPEKHVITVENFKMKFDTKMVIEDLSFEVARGEVFGFLGANGSGKTTTLRALLGLYEPTAGRLLINGKRFSSDMGQFLGYLPEERGLYKKESVVGVMTFFGQLKGMTRKDALDWSLEYLRQVGLLDKAKEQLGKLSSGQQQKIQIGVTIMNNPWLLILDEPTKGFDPVNRRLMLDIIRERVSDGATVVLVTHQMEEVERLCDRIVLLKDGQRRLYGSVHDIRQEYGDNYIGLEFNGTLRPNDSLYSIVHHAANVADLIPNEGVQGTDILKFLSGEKDLRISKFELRRASLDDIFVRIYQEDKKSKHA